MVRLRKRFTLARLCAIPVIVGVTLTVCINTQTPWQMTAVNTALVLLPVFVTGPTIPMWVGFYVVAGFLVGLMCPIRTHYSPRVVAPVRPSMVTRPADAETPTNISGPQPTTPGLLPDEPLTGARP